MKTILLLITLAFGTPLFSQQFIMGKHGLPPEYAMKEGIRPRPCGHGNQQICVPLTDYLPLLILAAIAIGIKKLK